MTTLLKWHLLTLLEQGLQGNSEMYHLVWKAVPPCLMWNIWSQRNKMVFEVKKFVCRD